MKLKDRETKRGAHLGKVKACEHCVEDRLYFELRDNRKTILLRKDTFNPLFRRSEAVLKVPGVLYGAIAKNTIPKMFAYGKNKAAFDSCSFKFRQTSIRILIISDQLDLDDSSTASMPSDTL